MQGKSFATHFKENGTWDFNLDWSKMTANKIANFACWWEMFFRNQYKSIDMLLTDGELNEHNEPDQCIE